MIRRTTESRFLTSYNMMLSAVFSGRSRPSDRGGRDSHPDPQMREGPVSKKILFVLQASFWSKNKKEGGGALLDLPLVLLLYGSNCSNLE